MVNVEASINTRRSDGSTIEFAEYLEIPLSVYSANGGLAKITMPVKVGDTVTLLYSQRDTEQYLAGDMSKVYDSEALRVMGEYPVVAIPCSYTEGKPIEVDPDNIIIQNDKITTTITPTGDQTTENETVKVEYLNSGDITITNGGCTVEIKAGGDVDVNTSGNITATTSGNIDATASSATVTASTINLTGAVTIDGTLNVTGATTTTTIAATAITASSVTGGSMGTTGGADMDDIKAKYNSHNHISSGSGNPSGPADPQI